MFVCVSVCVCVAHKIHFLWLEVLSRALSTDTTRQSDAVIMVCHANPANHYEYSNIEFF